MRAYSPVGCKSIVKAFITGITGFAGTHLAEHLLACGDEVLGCSRAGTWRADAPQSLQQAAGLIAWDVSRPLSDLRDRIDGFAPDCIYHLAALSVTSACGERQPNEAALATNVGGTCAVIDLAVSLTRRPRLLMVSSCYVYAPVAAVSPIVSEDSPLGPTGGYGKSKLAAEQEIDSALQQGRVDGVIARVFQHSGPRQSPQMIIPQWCRQFVRGEDPIEVLSLDTHLDLTDVRDIVRAYRLLIEHGRRGQTYNVGSGICRRSGEVFDELRRLHDPARGVVELAPGHVQHPVADVRRIASDADWTPEIPLHQTLSDTLAYWKIHELD